MRRETKLCHYMCVVTVIYFGAFFNALAGGEKTPMLASTNPDDTLVWNGTPEQAQLSSGTITLAYEAIQEGLRLGKAPGAVCVIARNGVALPIRAFGYAEITPIKRAMTPSTIFDLASLTKMVATTTAVMILVEQGHINLDDPVAKYLPEFGAHGKDTITVKQLLTHTSGLPAWKRLYSEYRGREAFYKAICETELQNPPGTKNVYSDLGFITLGLLVEKVSGMDLNSFTHKHIFAPLKMTDTMFNPPEALKSLCAATEIVPWLNRLMLGEVHDENANAMGGVAGHAGLFSTAHDLAIFCQMLVNGGEYGGVRILKPETVEQFSIPQLDESISTSQGLGWRLAGRRMGGTGGLGEGSFGHTGFTGTCIWINPRLKLFAVLLTNAVHPKRENADANYIRRRFYQRVLQASQAEEAKEKGAPISLLPPDEDWVQKTLAQMTLEDKVGQLLCPAYRGLAPEALKQIKDLHLGGLIVFTGNARDIARDLNTFQEAAKYPLLIGADYERGVGNYVDNATDLPGNMALGASGRPEDAYLAGKITATEARAIGVQCTFSPVLDVNNNPQNPIINIRSFGENPEQVARLGVAYILGAQEHGLLCTAKHFPGHGNTNVDSHSSLAKISGSREEMNKVELYPFRKAVEEAKVAAIMTAHLWAPAFDPEPLPATVSPRVMTGLLRDEWHFDGLLFTDAMTMGGITKELSYDESILKAIEAGCDIILMPADVARAYKAILDAVNSGRITKERLDASVVRLLRDKTRVGLHKDRLVDLGVIAENVGNQANYEAAKEIAKHAITLVKDEQHLLPIKPEQRVAVIGLANQVGRLMIWRDLYSFGDEMKKRTPNAEWLFMGDKVTEADRQHAIDMAKKSDIAVIAAYPRLIIGRGNVNLNPEQVQFLKEILALGKPAILISFASPYVIDEVPQFQTYLCAYGNAAAVQDAMADALYGKFKPSGTLPVALTPRAK
jgi:beta-N-acetylhexosaminidase